MKSRNTARLVLIAFGLTSASVGSLAQSLPDKAYNCSTQKGSQSIRAFLPNGIFYVERKDANATTYFAAKYKLNRGNTQVQSGIGVGYDSPRMKQGAGAWEEIPHLNYDEYVVNANSAKVFVDAELRLNCVELEASEKRAFFQKAIAAAGESRGAERIPGFNDGRGQTPSEGLVAAQALPQCTGSNDMRQQVQATQPLAAAATRAMRQASGGSLDCQNMAKFYASSVLSKADALPALAAATVGTTTL
jgi:hypothetical protein